MRFKGYKNDVNSVCVLRESSKIISGSDYGTVRSWDLSKPDDDELTLNGHDDAAWSVCASADGLRVSSGSREKTVPLWNLQQEASEGEETKKRSKCMSWFCCRADGKNGTEEVASAASGVQAMHGQTASVRCVFFSPDVSLLESESHDGTVQIWNARTGKHTSVTLEGHKRIVLCDAFSPDGKLVASGSYDGTIRLWGTDTGASTGIVIDVYS